MQQRITMWLLLFIAFVSVDALLRGGQTRNDIRFQRSIPDQRQQHRKTKVVMLSYSNNRSNNNTDVQSNNGDGYPEVVGVIPLSGVDVINTSDSKPVDPWMYTPGDFRGNLRSADGLLILSNGLSAERLVESGQMVNLLYGNDSWYSPQRFHLQPNGGAVFRGNNATSAAAWVYLTNAGPDQENGNTEEWKRGGVGALEFDEDGDLIGYQRLLSTSAGNWAGGTTPWNSFITCEWWGCSQVDPFGNRDPESTTFAFVQNLHSFTYDISSDPQNPQFFVSKSEMEGTIVRLIPDEAALDCYFSTDDYDKWCTLRSGERSYLVLYDDQTFEWRDQDLSPAERVNSTNVVTIQNATYIAVKDGSLYAVSEPLNQVFCCDLHNQTYFIATSVDDLVPLVGNGRFLFPGGPNVYGRNDHFEYYTLMYGQVFGSLEKVNIVFSPNRIHMYAAYKTAGLIYDVTRIDGEPFDDGSYVDLTYASL